MLLLADMASFLLMRQAVRIIRDHAALGGVLAGVTSYWLPKGVLGGPQYGAALLLTLLLAGNYGQGDARHDAKSLLVASSLASAFVIWDSLWTVGMSQVLPSFVAATLLVWTGLVLERSVVDRLVRRLGFPRPHTARTVFVGDRAEFLTASAGPAFQTGSEYRVLGYVEPNGAQSADALGHLAALYGVLLEHQAEAVVVSGYLEEEHFRLVVQAAHDAGCELMAVPGRLHITGVEPRLLWLRGQPLIELTSPAFKGQEQVLKRLMDFCVAAVGLLLLSPLFAFIAIAIRIESRGPVFYQSRRWGRFWTRIGIWKFRTMVDGAAGLLDRDEKLAAAFADNIKIVDDPRVTRVGWLLRRTSLDELPQLFNVLLGDMSLVGPRPKLLGEEDRYGTAMDTVLAVRPGMTGLWQVSGRNSTTYEERVALDIRYAGNPSLWGDVEILLRTVPVVLRGHGAH